MHKIIRYRNTRCISEIRRDEMIILQKLPKINVGIFKSFLKLLHYIPLFLSSVSHKKLSKLKYLLTDLTLNQTLNNRVSG